MYKRNISLFNGLVVFAISLVVYFITLEPTVSFWDCGEFITCANGLEVGHAPGAPLFMLLGRIFSLLAGSNNGKAAFMINALSATASALTIMFLYLTLLHFAQKLIDKNRKVNQKNKSFMPHAASILGALSFAFTDSFWFSAVEAEVYATSSLFSAIVFWAILKWESSKDNNMRWIILIFYLLGLSVGVHLLNILAIPAMALVVYFKKYSSTLKGLVITLLISLLLILSQIFFIIPGIAKLAANTDLLFVNKLNLPVYSGALFAIFALSVFLWRLYKHSLKKKLALLRIIILAFTFWLIGYSSFTVLVIRSHANTFVDINNVENIFGLVFYLNREQYPSRPLLFGNNYNSPITGINEKYTYKLINGKYVKDEKNPEFTFDNRTCTLFPRMASREPRHIDAYKSWVHIKGRKVKIMNSQGKRVTTEVPTFGDNIRFFLKYQVGHMYLRYFMWNFVGKQNDIQGLGSNLEGNWISGISFIDNTRLGNQSKLSFPYHNKKTKNTYYFIPLLIGLIGILHQFKKNINGFWILVSLFFFTGIAIVIYLNEVPITPRERDYVHVISFYVFSIWIGIGALAILEKISGLTDSRILNMAVWTALMVAVPGILLFENYDDHNRANRYTARDFATNMLSSCRKNGILFTSADNDTYPIWYLQEVEKYRQDVRQVLTTFLPVDWYARQLGMEQEKKEGIKISFQDEELLQSKNSHFPIANKLDSAIDIKGLIGFIKSDDPRTKIRASDNSFLNYIPGRKILLNVNKVSLLKNYPELNTCADSIPNKIIFTISKEYLGRDALLILDILANNDWKKPVYFIYPELASALGLSEYIHMEGSVYCLLPFKNTMPYEAQKPMNIKNHDLIMEHFQWGNMEKENVFLDEQNIRMISAMRYKPMFVALAEKLVQTNEEEKAEKLLDKARFLFKGKRIPFTFFDTGMVNAYYILGAWEKGDRLALELKNTISNRLECYIGDGRFKNLNMQKYQQDLYTLQRLMLISENFKRETKLSIREVFLKYYKMTGIADSR